MSAGNVVSLEQRSKPVYDYALVPAGEYDARLVDNHTEIYWRTASRLVLTWQLCTMGYVGTVLRSYYAVPGLVGRVGRNGRYRAVGRASRLARDLAALLGGRPAVLAGPFPFEDLRSRLYRVAVVTVTRDHAQIELPKGAQYSRVERVLGEAV